MEDNVAVVEVVSGAAASVFVVSSSAWTARLRPARSRVAERRRLRAAAFPDGRPNARLDFEGRAQRSSVGGSLAPPSHHRTLRGARPRCVLGVGHCSGGVCLVDLVPLDVRRGWTM